MNKTVKTALTILSRGAIILLAYGYGYWIGSKEGIRKSFARGYWRGREFERYLQERIKETAVEFSGDGRHTNGENESEVKK
jgi:hypothetical protein